MKVKFSRCNSSNLTNVPIVDGQLIFIKDKGECYLDVGVNRVKIEDTILKEKVSIIESSIDTIESSLEDYVARISKNETDISQLKHDLANVEAMHGFEEYEGIVTNGTTSDFFESLKTLKLNPGTILLGATQLTDVEDVASGMKNEEMKVEIYPNDVFHATMTSTDIAPYEWTIQYWKGNEKWRVFGTAASASSFDNTETNLEATTVQQAVVELDTKVGDISALLDKINGNTTTDTTVEEDSSVKEGGTE